MGRINKGGVKLGKIGKFLNQWGYYILAVFCIGTILLSAAWTNGQRALEIPGAQALADESQHLGEQEETKPALIRPIEGKILRSFSWEPVFFQELGLWQAHPGLDFSAQPGEIVCAMKEGSIRVASQGLFIDCPDGSMLFYRGIQSLSVLDGQKIKAGTPLGLAGAGVSFEGENHICVQLWQAGTWTDFSDAFSQ